MAGRVDLSIAGEPGMEDYLSNLADMEELEGGPQQLGFGPSMSDLWEEYLADCSLEGRSSAVRALLARMSWRLVAAGSQSVGRKAPIYSHPLLQVHTHFPEQ